MKIKNKTIKATAELIQKLIQADNKDPIWSIMPDIINLRKMLIEDGALDVREDYTE